MIKTISSASVGIFDDIQYGKILNESISELHSSLHVLVPTLQMVSRIG